MKVWQKLSLMNSRIVTGFWKISLNVTFCNSNICSQNEEQELPINLKVVTMCSSYFELPENNWKYFEKFCNPFALVTINWAIYVFQCVIRTDFPKSGHNWRNLPNFHMPISYFYIVHYWVHSKFTKLSFANLHWKAFCQLRSCQCIVFYGKWNCFVYLYL